ASRSAKAHRADPRSPAGKSDLWLSSPCARETRARLVLTTWKGEGHVSTPEPKSGRQSDMRRRMSVCEASDRDVFRQMTVRRACQGTFAGACAEFNGQRTPRWPGTAEVRRLEEQLRSRT